MTIIVDKVLEEAVSQSVKKLVQTVGDNFKQIRGISSEIRGLSYDIAAFNARLVDAFRNPRANELQLLEVVLEEFQSIVNDAQDAVDNYTNLMKKHRDNVLAKGWDHIPFPFCGNVKECASEIQFIRARMKTIRQDHEIDLRSLMNFENTTVSPNQVGPVLEEDCFVGFDAELKEIKTRLMEASDDFIVISIVGVPGTGKTTFAKKVFEDLKAFQDLDNKSVHWIWVHVSERFNRKQKFIDILNQVVKPAENFSKLSEEVLELRIKDTLGDKKYFIVMDDIWEKKHWDSLQVALPKSKGSRVLATTRHQSVADSIGESRSLPKLQPATCWSLLKNIVFGKGGSCNDSLETHGKVIAEKCEGLPLAIVVIAGILRKCRTVADWRRMAENPFLEINRKDQIYHKIVMLSCNHLPHEKLKNCFLYFASFPMGHEIPARKLIRLWIAEGFIPTKDDRGGYSLDVEIEAQKYLSDLVDRNLVKVVKRSADGQIKVCSILDSLHEFCKIEAAKKNLFHIMDGRHRLDVNTISPRRLCYHFINDIFDAEVSDTFDAQISKIFETENNASRSFISRYIKKKSPCSYGKHVHSLLLSSSKKSESLLKHEQLASIPNNFPLLRVLDVESHNFSLLPEFFGLEHLRYLAIKTDLDRLPKQFKNFRSLETLVYRTTKSTVEITEGIWDMEKLRHVCTNTSARLPSPPKNTSPSTEIRTLSTISPVSCTEKIFCKTPKLQKLGVRGNLAELLGNKHGICLFNNLQKLSCLETLKLHGQSGKVSKVPMPDKFPRRLRKLTFSNTLFDWNDINILAMLHELEVLKLDDNAFTGEIWDVDNNVVFKQLQYLRIGTSNLVTWTAQEISFPVLESLVLKNCTCLEGIPSAIANKQGIKVQELFHGSGKVANPARKARLVAEKDYVFGFEDDLEKIMARLTEASENFIVISILGMPGTGKTAFAKKIFENPDIHDKFVHCIKIDVSQSFDRKHKFIQMLHQIPSCTEDFKNSSEDQLEDKIKNYLKDEKCFILMDDVWEKKDWDSLKAAFPEDTKGIIRVLVTTRARSVAEYIGEPHSLPVLSPDDSWVLLEKKVFGEEGCLDESLRAIGKRIATRCNGLPLAIVRVARILRVCRTTVDWERVAENPFLEIYHKDQFLHKAVMLYLPEKLKSCFLYFACFPMGKEIHARKLIRLWIAEGFIQTSNGEHGNTSDMEVEAQEYLNDLVDKNLVRVLKRRADGQIKTCRIDDSLHELCKSEAAKKNLFQVMNGGQRLDLDTISSPRLCFDSSVTNIFVAEKTPYLFQGCYNKKWSPRSCSEYVQSLLLSCTKKSEVYLTQEQLAFIRNTFPHVRVLDIESFKLGFVPDELFGLHCLRYLAITADLILLRKPFKNLCELETLVIQSTKSTLKIKAGIWNMEKLKHVHTNTSAHLPSPPKTSKNSSDIRTLSTISPSSCTDEIFSKTAKLQKLGVRGNLAELLGKKQEICLFNNLQKLSGLENLKLHGQSENVSKFPMPDKFPGSLRKLTLSNTFFEWNDMSSLGLLEVLEVLKFEENAFTGELWDLNKNVVFNQLKYLRIGKTNLVTWTAAKESFPALESLVIRNCTDLKGIPYTFAEVRSLKAMELFHMSKRVIDSAEGVNKQRQDKEDIKTFKLLIFSPKATEHKQTDGEIPTTSIVSQAMAPVVVGFENEVKIIMNHLLSGSKELAVISIEGVAGIGKTTLTKMVFTHHKIQSYFDSSCWVCVSRTYNKRQILLGILRDLTKSSERFHDMHSEDYLSCQIYKYLKGKRYLIVVDDVWTEHDWDSLRMVFPNDMYGSRILITTRLHSVASYVDSYGNPHRLRFLSIEDSWKLLQEKVFGNEGCPPELEPLCMSIAMKCKGLPLAILLIAGILAKTSERAMPALLKQIADEDLFHVINENCKPLVKLSYDDLPYYLKYCFLYLAAFPRGHEIPVWKLIRLWIAEGFISEMEGEYTSDLEHIAEEYLESLADRNLLMVLKRRADGRIKTCCMHDMFYEFCQTEAANENLFHEMDGVTLRGKETPRRICIHSSSFLDFLRSESKPSGEHVRSFLSFCSNGIEDIPTEHLAVIPKSFPLLRVMAVESFKFQRFPKQLCELYHVRYLSISTNFKVLPIYFENLWNMQTLVLNTSARSLEFKAGIWKFPKLRHVHSNASMQLPSPKISKRKVSINIQTLSTISPSSCTREILEKTPNLKKLGIRGNLAELMESKGGISMFHNLQNLSHLENLKLLNEVTPSQGAKLLRVPQLDKFPPRLRKLTLSKTRFPWADMCVLGALHELEVLKLEEYAFMGEFWELDEDIVFNSLRFLRIGKTDLVSWTISESCFPVLETLVIRDCTQLEEIPSNFVYVFTLKRLELHCTNPLAVNSALLFQKEQQDFGNDNFEVSIYP